MVRKKKEKNRNNKNTTPEKPNVDKSRTPKKVSLVASAATSFPLFLHFYEKKKKRWLRSVPQRVLCRSLIEHVTAPSPPPPLSSRLPAYLPSSPLPTPAPVSIMPPIMCPSLPCLSRLPAYNTSPPPHSSLPKPPQHSTPFSLPPSASLNPHPLPPLPHSLHPRLVSRVGADSRGSIRPTTAAPCIRGGGDIAAAAGTAGRGAYYALHPQGPGAGSRHKAEGRARRGEALLAVCCALESVPARARWAHTVGIYGEYMRWVNTVGIR